MDNNVLFALDKSKLTDEGKAYLDQFLAAYVPVISGAIEEGKVSTIVVEGYTDSAGDESYNLKLLRKEHRLLQIILRQVIRNLRMLSKLSVMEKTILFWTEKAKKTLQHPARRGQICPEDRVEIKANIKKYNWKYEQIYKE